MRCWTPLKHVWRRCTPVPWRKHSQNGLHRTRKVWRRNSPAICRDEGKIIAYPSMLESSEEQVRRAGKALGQALACAPRRTKACRRPPIAYARPSLRPLAAPEARRSAALLHIYGIFAEFEDTLRE